MTRSRIGCSSSAAQVTFSHLAIDEISQELWTLKLGASRRGSRPIRAAPNPRALPRPDERRPDSQRMIVTGGTCSTGCTRTRRTGSRRRPRTFGIRSAPRDAAERRRAGIRRSSIAAHQRLVLFGGQTAGGTNVTPAWSNEVWVAPLGPNPVWTQLTPAGTPPAPRSDHSAIYDARTSA
jgi:hypothetical protein